MTMTTFIRSAMVEHSISQETIESIFAKAQELQVEALRKNIKKRNDDDFSQTQGAIRARRFRDKKRDNKRDLTINAIISIMSQK